MPAAIGDSGEGPPDTGGPLGSEQTPQLGGGTPPTGGGPDEPQIDIQVLREVIGYAM